MPIFTASTINDVPSLIAGKIRDYLESSGKRVDDTVLTDTVKRMRQVIVRDLMTPRDTRTGKESNTLYSGACARKSRLTFDGAEREPLKARTLLKFLLGDLVELSVLALANLAGCRIQDNNIDLVVMGEDGVSVPVHPDGRYEHDDVKQYNVEIKSCDSHTFDAWLATGGPDDTWGYLTQASMEISAWREAGVQVDATIFIAVSTGTRQGSIAEFIMPYDHQLVTAWHERRLLARQEAVPEVPFEGVPEMAFMRGKACDADWFAHGEPVPRVNEKGATYGWDVMTGRIVVPLQCSYCDFRAQHCWKNAVMEVDGTKPIWVIPAKDKATNDGLNVGGGVAGCPAVPPTTAPVSQDDSLPQTYDVFAQSSAYLDHQTALQEFANQYEGERLWADVVKDSLLTTEQRGELYKVYQKRLKQVKGK